MPCLEHFGLRPPRRVGETHGIEAQREGRQETEADFTVEMDLTSGGIEHFGRRFSEIGRLHDLGLDYLKVDASFVHGLESNPGNQAFLRGLSTIAHGIGMKVIAEGVASEDELAALGPVGFDAAMGPAVRAPD